MTEQEKKLYELALKEGNKRFGTPCSHRITINSVCAQCTRKVRHK